METTEVGEYYSVDKEFVHTVASERKRCIPAMLSKEEVAGLDEDSSIVNLVSGTWGKEASVDER